MLCSRLTVEFSPPWWVGTLERREAAREQYRLHRQKRQQKHRGH